ncbi:DUF5597 domain-containing protein [Pseudomonas sp. DCB_BI]|uniref:GH35 family beta-galactosidase n=1 Tax=Pseudomonas sp. DCB_BI TaxID=2993594 RepID=UPI00224B1698|nr:DUF5597 domain-containing protein [Pseudomonas sp. DCB_BI]MCX2891167.1 DUF5597 domain-containing protein [Pseudomonas sp. DCB_BI]
MYKGTRFPLWQGMSWLILAATLSLGSAYAKDSPTPEVRRNNGLLQLMVDDRPYIALAGEVHNSSASNTQYMKATWDKMEALNVNTAIIPIYWELTEPEEGRFDFALIKDHLAQAQARGMRIVLLWFGSKKNARSTYAPDWVRADPKRFPRTVIGSPGLQQKQGELPVLSIFSQSTLDADANAFAQVLKFLATHDKQHTVIAVQVQNETGLLGDSRERSPEAEEAWKREVPSELMAHLEHNKQALSPFIKEAWAKQGYRTTGTWPEVFGDDMRGDEIFMAWHQARSVDTVAAAGKKQLPLPMYANAWLGPQAPQDSAGTYPSGGPVPQVMDIWTAGAPQLDWLSPDIYVDDFDAWASQYTTSDNMLFVPEARFIVGNLFKTIGLYRGVGFSPFGIEDGFLGNEIAEVYGLLGPMTEVIARTQADNKIRGFALEPTSQEQFTFDNYTITVKGQHESLLTKLRDMGVPPPVDRRAKKQQADSSVAPDSSDLRPSGLIIETGSDEFLIVGRDLYLEFKPKQGSQESVEISRVEEGSFQAGKWVAGRVLNGDQRLRLVPPDRFGIAKIKLIRH